MEGTRKDIVYTNQLYECLEKLHEGPDEIYKRSVKCSPGYEWVYKDTFYDDDDPDMPKVILQPHHARDILMATARRVLISRGWCERIPNKWIIRDEVYDCTKHTGVCLLSALQMEWILCYR